MWQAHVQNDEWKATPTLDNTQSGNYVQDNRLGQLHGKFTQSCPTLCDPMDCSLPRSSIYGIFQARVLEWGAIAFSQQRNLKILFSKFN